VDSTPEFPQVAARLQAQRRVQVHQADPLGVLEQTQVRSDQKQKSAEVEVDHIPQRLHLKDGEEGQDRYRLEPGLGDQGRHCAQQFLTDQQHDGHSQEEGQRVEYFCVG